MAKNRARPDCCVIAILTIVVASPAMGQFSFVDVSTSRGIGPYTMAEGMGAGVAAADYDDDGDIDIFVPNGINVPDQLYRNLGDGTFEEIAGVVGLASLADDRAGLWLDYDGDSKLDLIVINDALGSPSPCRLHRQLPSGQFENVTVAAGLSGALLFNDGAQLGGLCAGDINNDRYLDLYICVWDGAAYLFLNDTQGGFVDISSASGVGATTTHWQPIMHDFDGDGWIDVFQPVDFQPNLLWLNQRNSTFIDVAGTAGVDNAFNDMGVTLGDYDNDGDFDLYITNAARNGMHNVFYRNQTVGSNPAFVEISQSLGVDNGYWGWGTAFLDADNDGWLDLAATNGAGVLPWLNDPSRFWHNLAGNPPAYSDVSATVNFNDTFWGSGLITLDYDRDGDPDLVQACAQGGALRLLENQRTGAAAANHFLVVIPRMAGPNHRAIGAVVHLQIGQTTMSRLITAGTSYLSQEPAEACFGLGSSTVIDELSISWPDGSQTILAGVSVDQVLTVSHAGFGDLDADGVVGGSDVAIFKPCYTDPGPGPGTILYVAGCRPADMNGDGDVDCADWRVLSSAYLSATGVLPILNASDFTAALLGLQTAPVDLCIADMNQDGINDGRDIALYVGAVLAGA